MNRINILLLLLLVAFIPSRSFACDDDQDSISYDAHLLSVQEYCQFLMAAASAEDVHGLYNAETMKGEIVQGASSDDQQPHFLYGIVRGVDPQTPMLGLTEFEAIRYCNWMETSLPFSDSIAASTEVGSYLLHEDGSFEVNDKALIHVISNDDGTFEIVSKVVKK